MPNPYGLTRAQRDCLLVIQELSGDGVPPSLDEIAHELCLCNRGRAHALLTGLRDRGFLTWLPHRARSIAVVRPIPAPEEPEIVGTFEAPPQLLAAWRAASART